jgi:hypothetical protein
MKLRRNQYCPIHRSLSCRGRLSFRFSWAIWPSFELGVQTLLRHSHCTPSKEVFDVSG